MSDLSQTPSVFFPHTLSPRVHLPTPLHLVFTVEGDGRLLEFELVLAEMRVVGSHALLRAAAH